MTTPASSATTPSPPMAFLQANPVSLMTGSTVSDIGANEREERQRAIQKFLARAEISKLTRGLRARLSYATYKATHNVSHLPIGDLESHVRDDTLTGWMPSRNNYYDNPATQGGIATTTSGGSARKGAMAPPTTIPSSGSRTHFASSGKEKEAATANATQSLYASILAPPPAKRARTIHNPEDPPVPAPAKMTNGTPRPRKRSSHPDDSRGAHSRTGSGSLAYSSVAEHTRANTRTSKGVKRKGASRGKGGGKHRDVRATDSRNSHDVDVDMKAAATLTHLLRHSRSSITSLGAVSPRSSMSAGSDVGSVHSLSQFAQSSTRTTTAQTSLVSSQESSNASLLARPATPPRSSDMRPASGNEGQPGGGSASASATDQEAIKLLYYLHESPSPARPSTDRGRGGQDTSAFAALSGNSDLRAKGRVLFPTSSGAPPDASSSHRVLTRDNSGSSTMSAVLPPESPTSRTLAREPTLVVDPPIGDVDLSQHPNPPNFASYEIDGPPITKVTPPTPVEVSPGVQLLPPPSSPRRAAQFAPSTQLVSPPTEQKTHHAAPATPGTYTFNLNDFINVSPSPAGPHRTTRHISRACLAFAAVVAAGNYLRKSKASTP
ncbi:hypothetical protein BC834DRAFT_968586 [Gloeopeniophorella convolvens]|nr:hypothetical protein BC834DRAFT_968586 [Gloeopeniophorella convolvens]